MPTPKTILFLVALLFLIPPVSADSVLLGVYSDSTYMKTYISGTVAFLNSGGSYQNIAYASSSSGSSSYVLFETDTFEDLPVQSDVDGIIYYSFDSNDMSPAYYSYDLSDSEVGNITGHVNWYRKYRDSSEDGDTFYIQAYVYIDSYTLVTPELPDPNVNSSASLTFSKSVADSSDLITYSWNIDPYLTGEYSEVYTGYTGQETYQILLDVAYSENTASNGEVLTIVLGAPYGSGALYTGDYWLGDNYTLTATLWHDATYYDMLYFTEPIEVSEFLDTAYVHVSEVVADDDTEDPDTPDENSTNPEIPELPEVPEIPEYPDLPNATGDYEADENGSVNSTWLTGYHSSVNSAFAPVDNAVSGTLSYFMSPVIMFITYIVMITDIAVVTLEQILMMVASVSVLLSAVFSVIPDKVLMVGTYALLLDSLAVILGR